MWDVLSQCKMPKNLKPEPEKIKQIFDYLATESYPFQNANGAFVFCRADPLVANRAAEFYEKQKVEYILVTGGKGKDSGPLIELDCPEAVYQAVLLHWVHRIPDNKILVEPTATNGAENSRFGIDVIVNSELSHDELIMIVHPTSLRRTLAVHQMIAEET